MRRARWKRKNVRRVGLRPRRPPSAGGGRLAVPCGSQGRKRAVLGETFGPGKSGIHPAPLFAAAGEWSMKVAAWVNATVSTTARAARSEAERAEGGTSGTLVTEILGAPQRETVKEKLVKCVLAPRRGRHHPPRDGSIDLAEDPSVPEGQPKSTLAPIRRPPSRGGPLHRSAPKRSFLLDRARPVFFSAKTEKKMGVHPAWTMPPAGAGSPPAAGRRLLHTPWRVHRPAINIAAIPRLMGRSLPLFISKISKF